MKWFTLLNLFFVLLQPNLAFSNTAETTIYLYPGLSKSVPLGSKATLHATRKSVASITEFKGKTLLTGRTVGISTVRSKEKTIVVNVLSKKNYLTLETFTKLIVPLKGLSISYSESKIIIGGRLHRLQDWLLLSDAALNENHQFLFLAKIDRDIQPEVKESFFNLLRSAGLPKPLLSFPEDRLKVSFPKVSDQEKDNIKELLSPYGVTALFSENQPVELPLVEVQILVAEVRKNHFQRFGLQWPAAYSATLLPSWQPGSLEVTINALEQNGVAQLLASPKLMTQSGSKSKFLAGGQIPIRTLGWSKDGVVWKNYGILLEAEPTVSWNGHMHIKLTTEVSTIDQSQTVNGIPGFRTNKISNEFNISSGETIFLSGLIKNTTGESSEGLPLLSRIPILGRLFSSKDYQENKSELIFMVTPRLIE